MHIEGFRVLKDFNMHLLVTLQIIQPPAVYEPLSIARFLSIIYLVTTEHYHCI